MIITYHEFSTELAVCYMFRKMTDKNILNDYIDYGMPCSVIC